MLIPPHRPGQPIPMITADHPEIVLDMALDDMPTGRRVGSLQPGLLGSSEGHGYFVQKSRGRLEWYSFTYDGTPISNDQLPFLPAANRIEAHKLEGEGGAGDLVHHLRLDTSGFLAQARHG